MATSRSNERSGWWTAGVRLFSGRPDPEWRLPPLSGHRVEALWETLEPLDLAPPAPPPLGYRGCFACHPSGPCWEAYREVVTLVGPEVRELRRDRTRAVERFVLESAPPNLLPEGVFDLAGLSPED